MYNDKRILHTNRNISSFPKNIGSVAGILDPITRDIVSIGGLFLFVDNVYDDD